MTLTKTTADLVYASVTAADDDVTNWDFGQFHYNNVWFDYAVMRAHNIDFINPSADALVFMGLQCLSNVFSSTRYVKVQKEDGGRVRFCVNIRQLASGGYLTAHDGTFKHDKDRKHRCNCLGEMLLQLLDSVIASPNALGAHRDFVINVIKFTLLGQVEYHHSDDFLSFLLLISAPLLSFFDNVMFYADYLHLALKFEAGASDANVKHNYGWGQDVIDELYGMLDPKFVRKYSLDKGTSDGAVYTNGRILNPVIVYDRPTRLAKQFKSVFSRIEFTKEHPYGNIVVQGATFLQFLMVRMERGLRLNCDGTFLYPFRPSERLCAKLVRTPAKLTDDFDFLMKLISFTFLGVGNRAFYEDVKEVFFNYVNEHKISLSQLGQRLRECEKHRTDYFFKLGVIGKMDRLLFPDYDRVLQFFSNTEDGDNQRNYRMVLQYHRGDLPGFDILRPKRAPNKPMATTVRNTALMQLAQAKSFKNPAGRYTYNSYINGFYNLMEDSEFAIPGQRW